VRYNFVRVTFQINAFVPKYRLWAQFGLLDPIAQKLDRLSHSPRTSKMCCVQSDMKILRQKNLKSETVVLCRVRESNVNILSGRATFVASHGEQFELIVECIC
jgi:hypothetical protein